MIETSALEVVAAIEAALADELPTVTVDVYPYEPETAAPPCVWLSFIEARWSTGGWVITHDATVVADAGLGAVDAQTQLSAITTAVLHCDCKGVASIDMSARGGGLTTRIGDIGHPVHVVSIPQLSTIC